ncbi:glycosyltransferase [Parasphingopyxis sp.]|uniref:glycosyltransferase family 2 protein n=1 Tax=Parasphingopyxis sp. TaxID=1920299 RepID=UPI002606152A|nr:glycosyltransferase [Parasphingopyxis sp.]
MATEQTAPVFTILLPIHRPPHMLPIAVESVLAQHEQSFELFILCDGAPAATVTKAEELAQTDARIAVRAFPKGERHGEAYRGQIIEQESRGRFICQIADDDMWMPDFLAQMRRLLAHADFGNLLQVLAEPDGRFLTYGFDLGHEKTRTRMLEKRFNFFGPSACGYRRTAYHRLEEGWSPAPEDIWTDLFMWRKFLRLDGIRCATRHEIGVITMPTPYRLQMSLEERAAENRAMLTRVQDRRQRDDLVQAIRRDAAREYFHLRFPG